MQVLFERKQFFSDFYIVRIINTRAEHFFILIQTVKSMYSLIVSFVPFFFDKMDMCVTYESRMLKRTKHMGRSLKMSHLLHIRGNENEIYAAESKLRDAQKHINQFSVTKLRDGNINGDALICVCKAES